MDFSSSSLLATPPVLRKQRVLASLSTSVLNVPDRTGTPPFLTPSSPSLPTPSPSSTLAESPQLLSTPTTPVGPASSPLSLKRKRSASNTSDRFIPCRSRIQAEHANFLLMKESPKEELATNFSREKYKSSLSAAVFQDSSPRILAFSPAKRPSSSSSAKKQLTFSSQDEPSPPKRRLMSNPERVIIAPDLLDDYYLNLIDWGRSNSVAVALGKSVFLWNATTHTASPLMELEGDADVITSVKWNGDGTHVAIGTSKHEVLLWDVARQQRVYSETRHQGRVGCLAWRGADVLTSGCRDGSIINRDIRSPSAYSLLQRHDQEICGLQWSGEGTHLASGANDNKLLVWDERSLSFSSSTSSSSLSPAIAPLHEFTLHTAAVKAIAWCPWQRGLLASGGGTSDRTIRFWDVDSGRCLNSIDTRSQVCAIQWSRHSRELVSSHGFSQNHLTVWRYPDMAKIADLTGHTSRVLHLSLSPDGTTVVSAGGDETLRFWRLWEKPRVSAHHRDDFNSPHTQRMHGYSIR